ncbi:MAG: hypothetical protein GH155_01630 [Spirochaeta sp.]|nr:hypothetical protein [Spirochaeta sp.]
MKPFIRTSLLVIFLVSAALLPLGAEEFMVEYLEGILEVSQGSNWIEVDIGDTIPQYSSLRLSDNGLAELSAGTVTVTLIEDGIFSVESLLNSGREVAAWNISRLISPDQQQSTTFMGVRGDAAEEAELTWMEEGEEYLEDGKELMLAGKYAEAREILQQGADNSFSDEKKEEFNFYIASTYAMEGKSAPALLMLTDMEIGSSAPYYSDYVLLKGKLLIEGLAYQKALLLFDQYLKNPDRSETAQLIYFLSALCNQKLENRQQSLSNLEAAYEINNTSEYGLAAKRMMDNL